MKLVTKRSIDSHGPVRTHVLEYRIDVSQEDMAYLHTYSSEISAICTRHKVTPISGIILTHFIAERSNDFNKLEDLIAKYKIVIAEITSFIETAKLYQNQHEQTY